MHASAACHLFHLDCLNEYAFHLGWCLKYAVDTLYILCAACDGKYYSDSNSSVGGSNSTA